MDSFDKEKAEAFYSKVQNVTNRPEYFSAVNNITITKVGDGYAEGELTITQHSLNPLGIVHGGCLATLADTVAGAAVASRRRASVTLNYAMNFLAPATGTKIKCIAAPLKVGRTVCVYSCVLTDDGDHRVATGDFTFIVVEKDRFREPK
ncbi:MAG: PaaI family thioesterase [Clostridia bacterium]|nr:PaaI family thioesterase [Clostridia bacterium]